MWNVRPVRSVGMIAINCRPSFKWQINKIQFDSKLFEKQFKKNNFLFWSLSGVHNWDVRSKVHSVARTTFEPQSAWYSDAKLLIREISLKKRFAIPDKDDNSWRLLENQWRVFCEDSLVESLQPSLSSHSPLAAQWNSEILIKMPSNEFKILPL